MDKEFRVLSLSIEKFSLFYGGFLILWGVTVSLISESTSLTSFIPSFLGLPLVIFSFLAIKFTSKKKLFMHIVVIFGLVIFLGGLDVIRSLVNGIAFENFWADSSKTVMLLTGLYFLVQCIKSFIFARKNRS
ncbi:MAG: hypothetical protein CL687_00555 [Candidatus Pelagibacter sp.]|nr:hypothetical protein [Candidatus Pelagibacter sp.]